MKYSDGIITLWYLLTWISDVVGHRSGIRHRKRKPHTQLTFKAKGSMIHAFPEQCLESAIPA